SSKRTRVCSGCAGTPAVCKQATRSEGGITAGSYSVEADVVLGERGRGGLGACHVPELRELQPQVEQVVAEAVQHRGHPPGEVLRSPDAPQALRRVTVEEVVAAAAVVTHERLREDAHVVDREIQALGAR